MIGAEQAHPVVVDQLVPQLFEPDGGGVVLVLPQGIHHLAEEPDLAVARVPETVEHRDDHGAERRAVGHPIDHESGERSFRIDRDESTMAGRRCHVATDGGQALRQRRDVFRGGDDDRRFTLSQTGADEPGECPDHHRVVGIELNDVVTRKRRAKESVPALGFVCHGLSPPDEIAGAHGT